MTSEKVSIGRIKRDVSDLVNRVAYGGERIILTSRGKPKAALVSIDDLERLRRAEEPESLPLSEAGSLDELVAAIRRLPPGRDTYEPGRGSLAAALAAQPGNPDFDLQSWNVEWARVEAEMARIEAEDAAGMSYLDALPTGHQSSFAAGNGRPSCPQRNSGARCGW